MTAGVIISPARLPQIFPFWLQHLAWWGEVIEKWDYWQVGWIFCHPGSLDSEFVYCCDGLLRVLGRESVVVSQASSSLASQRFPSAVGNSCLSVILESMWEVYIIYVRVQCDIADVVSLWQRPQPSGQGQGHLIIVFCIGSLLRVIMRWVLMKDGG